MMRIPGRIPITIHPSFWIFAGILGWLIGRSIFGALIWLGIIVFSLLFHEFGHALTALVFGQKPRIELVALGGLTYPEGKKISWRKEFLVVLAGPLAGFCLYLISRFLLGVGSLSLGMSGYILEGVAEINLWWTLINLVPVIPLDGGQLLRIVCEACFGVKGVKYALLAGALIATTVSLFFFFLHQFIAGAFFFLFAFQSFDLWRKSKALHPSDQDAGVLDRFKKGETAFQEGRFDEARGHFEKVHEKNKKGVLFTGGLHYLALIKVKEGDFHGAYELLLPQKKALSGDLLTLLHKLAFEEKNYHLVLEIAGRCFREKPSLEIALRTAESAALLKQGDAAVGWLEAALNAGASNLSTFLASSSFNSIRKDPKFVEFVGRR